MSCESSRYQAGSPSKSYKFVMFFSVFIFWYSFYINLFWNIDCAPLQEAQIDQDLPKKLVVVEFRTLTLTEAPKVKPLRMPDTSCKKNFKCFRKVSAHCHVHHDNVQRRASSAVQQWCCPVCSFVCRLSTSTWISVSWHRHMLLLIVHGVY